MSSDTTTTYAQEVPTEAIVAAGSATGNPWLTTLATLLTIAASMFTGNGDVDDATVEALNGWSPGLGGLVKSAVNASNGLAPAYTEWAGDASLLGALGFLTPFNSKDGIVGKASTWLFKQNGWVVIALGVGAVMLWKSAGQPNPRFWKRDSSYTDGGEYI